MDLTFPRLTKLHFVTKQPASDAAAFVRRMLSAAPRLRRISVALDQRRFDVRTTPAFLPLLPILLRAGVEKLRLHEGLDMNKDMLTLGPLFRFYAAHHGWLKVCVYMRSDFDEIILRSAWEFSRPYDDSDRPNDGSNSEVEKKNDEDGEGGFD